MPEKFKTQAQGAHYLVFQGLLLLAFMFHQFEDWRDRPYAFFSLACLLLFVLLKKYRQFVFLFFLVVGSARYIYLFPNLANHSNLNLFLFLAILPYQWTLTRGKTAPKLENLMSLLRSLIFVLYFFTFFHKFNWDFLFPGTSCASSKLQDYIDLIPHSWTSLRYFAYKSGPWFGLIIEGIIPLTLPFKQTRRFALFFLIGLHFLLAPMGFTDFSSLAMAMAWCFVDVQKLKTDQLERHLSHLIGFCLFFELIFAFSRFPSGRESNEMLEGFLFALAYTPFLLIHFWGQVDRSSLKIPPSPFGKAFILIVFLFGFNNYLGLRTAGNFSMFSNLVTEGERGNHVLLGNNPFKIFGFQEDVVKILKVNAHGRDVYKNMPMKGQLIPRVEFSRILDVYREWGYQRVSMTILYEGEVRQTSSAGFDENFDLPSPWIYKKLLKFRAIQPSGRQYCYW